MAFASDGAAAVLFVTDPDRAVLPDVEAIRAAFGLTQAEAELTRCLAGGLAVEQAARELRLSVETVPVFAICANVQ